MEANGKWSTFPRLRDEQEILLPKADTFTSNLSQSTLDFIVKDDDEEFQRILNAMSLEGRRQFLSGDLFQERAKTSVETRTDYRAYPLHCCISENQSSDKCNLKNPFILAAAYGSHSILQCMLANGCNVLQTDNSDYNVIHALIYIAHLQSHLETRANATLLFIKDEVKHEDYKKLLLMDNMNGLRPLEMSAHLGTFLIFHTIFETRGVYLTRESVQGIYTTQWFDVTEYENSRFGNRHRKSPLLSLTLIEKCKVSCPHARLLLTSSPAGVILRKWIEIKIACNRPLTAIWFLIRVINAGIFFMSIGLSEEMETPGDEISQPLSNQSSLLENDSVEYLSHAGKVASEETTYKAPLPLCLMFLVYLAVFSLLSVILDVYEYIKLVKGPSKKWFHTPMGKKRLAIHYNSYRFAHFSLSVSIFFIAVLVIALKEDLMKIPRFVDHIFLIHSVSCIVVSMKYFFQATSCIGPFIITFERMIKHLTCFVLVFMFFVFPYTFVFKHIVCDENGNELCEKHFSTFADAFYTVFTVTLNMMNFSMFHGVKYRIELFLIHIQYVFVIVMLLLNFLIAQFTRSLSNVMDNGHIIMPIQRMSIIWPTELRFMSCIQKYYDSMHRRYFIHIDGRLYIARTLIVHKPNKEEPVASNQKRMDSTEEVLNEPETTESKTKSRKKSSGQLGSFPFPL